MVLPGQDLQAMEVRRFTLVDSWETCVFIFCFILRSTAEEISPLQRDLARAYSGSLFLRHSYPVEIDITTQLRNHRGHQSHERSRVGLYGLFLLRL